VDEKASSANPPVPPPRRPDGAPDYAELRCVSAFTFLRGASQPEELVERAHTLGYSALAITDECSLAGVVRAHGAAKEHGLKLLIGAQFQVDWGALAGEATCPFVLTVLACNRNGYGNLSHFISKLRRSAAKPVRCWQGTRPARTGSIRWVLSLGPSSLRPAAAGWATAFRSRTRRARRSAHRLKIHLQVPLANRRRPVGGAR
jgi:hypothetical protein